MSETLLLSMDELEKESGLSRQTINRRVKDGTLPPPIKIGPRAVRWRRADIEAALEKLATRNTQEAGHG